MPLCLIIVTGYDLDLIPWALIYFDQALTSISRQRDNYNLLSSLQSHLLAWFKHYISNFDHVSAEPINVLTSDPDISETKETINLLRSNSKTTTLKSASIFNSKGILTYPLLSRFGREFGIVPQLIKEPQLFRYVHSCHLDHSA